MNNDIFLYESLIPSIPLYESALNSYNCVLNYISNKLLNSKTTFEQVIEEYNKNYSILSETITINELYSVFKDCHELLEIHDKNDSKSDDEYSDEKMAYNGFIKSEFVCHEHDSKRAPLHYDLRWKTEFKTSAFSFAIPKHKIPEGNEKILAKQQPMHPPAWVDMDHTQIGEGHGQGSVKTIDRGTIYYKIKNRSFTIVLKGKKYFGAYHLIHIKNSDYLFFEAKNNILPSIEERNNEWIQYAKNFINYLNKVFARKFNLNDNFLNYNEILISQSQLEYQNHLIMNENNSNTLYIYSVNNCIDIMKSNQVKELFSKDCKINHIEDIMRVNILRDYIAPKFFDYYIKLTKQDLISIIYEDIREIPYEDIDLNKIKNIDFNQYKKLKIYRMFSDIYLGHKYYGSFDFERYLINKLKDFI